MTSNAHECPAKGCTEVVPFDVLACKPHWFSLPPAIRSAISRTWRQGDLEQWAEWRKAAVIALRGE